MVASTVPLCFKLLLRTDVHKKNGQDVKDFIRWKKILNLLPNDSWYQTVL
jgi:hypothetical protein